MKVLLAGEGPTELGRYARDRAYWSQPGSDGVLLALARKLGLELEVIDAVLWKAIRKFKAGDRRSPEQRNVLGLALRANEGALALVFARDRDGDDQREREVDGAIAEALAKYPRVPLAGGVPVEAIEAWVLAALGDPRPESHSQPKSKCDQQGAKTTEDKVAAIEASDLPVARARSPSLDRFATRLAALPRP